MVSNCVSIGSVKGKTFEIMALKCSILSKIIIVLLVRFYYYFGRAYDSSKKMSVILIPVNEWYLKWISRVILGICKNEVEVFLHTTESHTKELEPLLTFGRWKVADKFNHCFSLQNHEWWMLYDGCQYFENKEIILLLFTRFVSLQHGINIFAEFTRHYSKAQGNSISRAETDY